MKINLKRLMSLAMAMVMVVQMMPLNAFAAEGEPTPAPAPTETVAPSTEPTAEPEASTEPTAAPTEAVEPTAAPSAEPAETAEPSAEPTAEPSAEPTAEPAETVEPSAEPVETTEPTVDPEKTEEPDVTPAQDKAAEDNADKEQAVGFAMPMTVSPDDGSTPDAQAVAPTVYTYVSYQYWTKVESEVGTTANATGESNEYSFVFSTNANEGTEIGDVTALTGAITAGITYIGTDSNITVSNKENGVFGITAKSSGNYTIPFTYKYGEAETDTTTLSIQFNVYTYSGDGGGNTGGGTSTPGDGTTVDKKYRLFQKYSPMMGWQEIYANINENGTLTVSTGTSYNDSIYLAFSEEDLSTNSSAKLFTGFDSLTSDNVVDIRTENGYYVITAKDVQDKLVGNTTINFKVGGKDYLELKVSTNNKSGLMYSDKDPTSTEFVDDRDWQVLKTTENRNGVELAVGQTRWYKPERGNVTLLKDSVTIRELDNNYKGDVEVSFSESGKYFAVTGGIKNGKAQVMIGASEPMGAGTNNFNYNVTVIVTGNEIVYADAVSDYATADIIQTYANKGTKSFIVNPAELVSYTGYTLNGNKLTFNTDGAAVGVYPVYMKNTDTSRGAKPTVIKYAIAVMPELTGTAQATVYKMNNMAPEDWTKDSADGIYKWYGNPNEDHTPARQQVFQTRADGTTIPVYLYRKLNGEVVDMTGYTVHSTNNSIGCDIVKVNGKDVVKVWIKDEYNIDKYSMVGGTVSIYDDNGTFLSAYECVAIGSTDENGKYNFGITTLPEQIVLGDNNNTFNLNAMSVYKGSVHEPMTGYFSKISGDDYTSAFAFYDDIDISTLTVKSTNENFVKATAFADKYNGQNILGITAQIIDTSKVQSGHIEIKFKDKNGNETFISWGASCNEPPVVNTVEVDTVKEFKEKYETMSDGIIKLVLDDGDASNGSDNGVFSMDLFHNKPIRIIGELKADGSPAITINGENDTNPGAILKMGIANPAEISNVIIDGRNRTRDGIDPNSCNAYADKIIVQNCNIGVKGSGVTGFVIYSRTATFRNNNTAILGSAISMDIRGTTFENNETAIDFTPVSGLTDSDPEYGIVIAKGNKFIENTMDFRVNSNFDMFRLQQNYFEHDKLATIPVYKVEAGKTGKIYYAPYYLASDMSVMSANVEGSEEISSVRRAATTTLNLPVTTIYTENTKSTKLDTAVFAEIKSNAEEYNVVIPVTEGTEKDNKVTTEWTFTEDSLVEKLPAQMDLQVTSTPSEEAKAIVDGKVSNTADIVQYVNFTHNGVLPGKATVKILKTTDMNEENLKLYYINETTGTVETAVICDVEEIRENGYTYFVVTVDHCSEYIITTGVTLKQETPAAPSTPATPSTPAAPVATATPAPTPAKTANDLVSSVEIEEKFEETADDTVVIDITDKKLVSAKLFEILAENPGKTVVLEGDGFRWTFSAEDITEVNAIRSTTFNPTISLTSPNRDAVKAAAGTEDIIHVYFAYHGNLPGKANVTVNVGPQHAGKTMYVYYFNASTNEIEYIRTIKVAANGDASFDILHCADYFMSEVKLHEDTTEDNRPQTQPTTPPADDTQAPAEASSMGMLPLILVAVAAVIIVVAVMAKKKKGE